MPAAGEGIFDFGPDWEKNCPNAYQVALFRRNWRTLACGRYMFSSETRMAQRWGALVPSYQAAKPVATPDEPTGAIPKAYRIPKAKGTVDEERPAND